jgi:hypothetical protein
MFTLKLFGKRLRICRFPKHLRNAPSRQTLHARSVLIQCPSRLTSVFSKWVATSRPLRLLLFKGSRRRVVLQSCDDRQVINLRAPALM